jgi:uncharacterized ion transporter superfamily protein YfcC
MYMKKWFLLYSSIFMFLTTTCLIILINCAIESLDISQRVLLTAMWVMGYLSSVVYLMLYIDKIGEDKQRHPKKYF